MHLFGARPLASDKDFFSGMARTDGHIRSIFGVLGFTVRSIPSRGQLEIGFLLAFQHSKVERMIGSEENQCVT